MRHKYNRIACFYVPDNDARFGIRKNHLADRDKKLKTLSISALIITFGNLYIQNHTNFYSCSNFQLSVGKVRRQVNVILNIIC